ncbi:hypothetical protein KIF59_10640 [Enterobacter cloacae subsp. cloacae]|nr:hypothetical protein [Enterobacter cloacae subsp. cloacae]
MEPYRPLFIEEPVRPSRRSTIRNWLNRPIFLSPQVSVCSRASSSNVLEAGGAAILQPDLPCGRYHRMLKIAGMAEAYDVALAPHCPLGPVALAACLHVDFVSLQCRVPGNRAWVFTITRARNCSTL